MSLSLATYMVPLWPEGSTAECGPQRRPSTGFDRIGTFMELYVIAGPNGAGKTTFAREFLPNYADCKKLHQCGHDCARHCTFLPGNRSSSRRQADARGNQAAGTAPN